MTERRDPPQPAEPTPDPSANGSAGAPADRPFGLVQAALLDLVGAARALLEATEQALADPATFEQVSGVVTGFAHKAFELVGPFLHPNADAAATASTAEADRSNGDQHQAPTARKPTAPKPAAPKAAAPKPKAPKPAAHGFERIDLG